MRGRSAWRALVAGQASILGGLARAPPSKRGPAQVIIILDNVEAQLPSMGSQLCQLLSVPLEAFNSIPSTTCGTRHSVGPATTHLQKVSYQEAVNQATGLLRCCFKQRYHFRTCSILSQASPKFQHRIGHMKH